MSSVNIRIICWVSRSLVLLCVTEVCVDLIKNVWNKQKRSWVWEMIKRRDKLRASATPMKELSVEDPKSYQNIMTLTVLKFDELLQFLTPVIKKPDTKLGREISYRTKLEITLRYITSGDKLKSLQYLFRLSHKTIFLFLSEILNKAVNEVLEPLTSVFIRLRCQLYFFSLLNFDQFIAAHIPYHFNLLMILLLKRKTCIFQFLNYIFESAFFNVPFQILERS